MAGEIGVGNGGRSLSIVEPGIIQTGFGTTAAHPLSAGDKASGPYADLKKTADEIMAQGYTSKMMATPPEAVASAVAKAVTARRPRSRYVVTPVARSLITMRRTVPDRAWDGFLRLQFRER